MKPVAGGWTSHKINSDGEYKSKLRAAESQARSNPYVQGLQEMADGGLGKAIQGTRGKFGNVNLMPQELLGQSNFAQKDIPGNQPMNDPTNQTGSAELDVSSTAVPQEDPESFEQSALDRRLAMMAKGGQGFPGLNNRSRGA